MRKPIGPSFISIEQRLGVALFCRILTWGAHKEILVGRPLDPQNIFDSNNASARLFQD